MLAPSGAGTNGDDFSESLTRLQGLIDKFVTVDVGLIDKFLGVRFTAKLERVETLGGMNGAVTVHFTNGATLDVAPGEQVIVRSGDRLDFLSGHNFVLELGPA